MVEARDIIANALRGPQPSVKDSEAFIVSDYDAHMVSANIVLAALTAAGYRVVREGELDAARQALIQQRAFIRHWIDDVNGGLKPTVGSLRAASDMVDAALRALAEAKP